MITVPELQATSALLDTDLVVITHANGQSEKMTGATLKSVISEDFQPKELETPLTIAGNEKDTVEDALDAINKAASNLPTDPVLHYSFDEVPDYPDGTAIAKYLENTYLFQNTPYFFSERIIQGGTTAITNENGNIKITISGAVGAGVYISTSSNQSSDTWDKIFKFKLKVTQIEGKLRCYDGLFNTVTEITEAGTYEFSFVHNNNSNSPAVYLALGAEESSVIFTVEQIYIGDGSYSTPIIDNANKQNNATNNGGIAVQGVSGKGAYFLNGKYAQVSNFNFTDNFSVSIWVKPDNMDNSKMGIIAGKASCFILRNGDNGNNNYVFGAIYNKTTSSYVYFNIQRASLLDNTKYTHICITKNGTTVKAFVDGVLSTTTNLNFSEMNRNNSSLTVTDTTNTRPQSVDDLLIFDRALSESEVMALYQNKANTPKYYTLADYQLKQKLPAVPSTDGTYSLKCTVASGTPTYSWVAES